MENKELLTEFNDKILGGNRSILLDVLNLSLRQLQKKFSGEVELYKAEEMLFDEILYRKYGLLSDKIIIDNRVAFKEFFINDVPDAPIIEQFVKDYGYTRVELAASLGRTVNSWKGLLRRKKTISPAEYNWLLLDLKCHPNNTNI